MEEFCNICGNKIDLAVDIDRNLIIQCNVCEDNKEDNKEVKLADKELYIISKFDAEIEKGINNRGLRNMEFDITNIKVEKKCINCNHNIMKMRRCGDALTRVYGCEKCGVKFTD